MLTKFLKFKNGLFLTQNRVWQKINIVSANKNRSYFPNFCKKQTF